MKADSARRISRSPSSINTVCIQVVFILTLIVWVRGTVDMTKFEAINFCPLA